MKKDPAGFRAYHIIAMLFVALLIISNIVAAKLITFFNFVLPAGILTFPLAYVINDVLTEVYGYEKARSTIWTGFVCLAILSITTYIAVALPFPPFWHTQKEFETTLGLVPRIAIASLCAYVVGSLLNSYVMSRMKVLTEGRHLWTRTIGSTIVGEGADSVIFNLVAFLGVFQLTDLGLIMLSGFTLKVAYEIIATPLTYAVVAWLKRYEEEDKFDIDIKYKVL